jgi:hypothetical protein
MALLGEAQAFRAAVSLSASCVAIDKLLASVQEAPHHAVSKIYATLSIKCEKIRREVVHAVGTSSTGAKRRAARALLHVLANAVEIPIGRRLARLGLVGFRR